MINFQTENIKFTLKNKTLLKTWIKSIIDKKKQKTGEITFVFCSDDYLLNINKQYLHHDTYTDIVTFDYSTDNPVKVSKLGNFKKKEKASRTISGDIFISIDRIKENAEKYSKSFGNELNRVIIHGILHLLGYTDKTKTTKEEMTEQENSCLNILKKIQVG